ncbi:MAG: hypothetical protein WEB13_01605, partial [Dehalococcoidia bacterium]
RIRTNDLSIYPFFSSLLEGGRAGEERRQESLRLWGEMKQLAGELSASWSKGVSAVDAVREQRREL